MCSTASYCLVHQVLIPLPLIVERLSLFRRTTAFGAAWSSGCLVEWEGIHLGWVGDVNYSVEALAQPHHLFLLIEDYNAIVRQYPISAIGGQTLHRGLLRDSGFGINLDTNVQ